MGGKNRQVDLVNLEVEQATAYLAGFHRLQSRLHPQISPSTSNQTMMCFLSTCWLFHIVFSFCSKSLSSVITALPPPRVLPLKSFHGEWLRSELGNQGHLAHQWPWRVYVAKGLWMVKEGLRVIGWVRGVGWEMFFKQSRGTQETKSG